MHQLDNNMAQSPPNSRRKEEPADMTVREWSLKARMVSRENTRSRRFSSSYITSFREDSRSFRTNITISSTASSPGYNLKGNNNIHISSAVNHLIVYDLIA